MNIAFHLNGLLFTVSFSPSALATATTTTTTATIHVDCPIQADQVILSLHLAPVLAYQWTWRRCLCTKQTQKQQPAPWKANNLLPMKQSKQLRATGRRMRPARLTCCISILQTSCRPPLSRRGAQN